MFPLGFGEITAVGALTANQWRPHDRSLLYLTIKFLGVAYSQVRVLHILKYGLISSLIRPLSLRTARYVWSVAQA